MFNVNMSTLVKGLDSLMWKAPQYFGHMADFTQYPEFFPASDVTILNKIENKLKI